MTDNLQPMDTAPTDGSKFIAKDFNGDWVVLSYSVPDGNPGTDWYDYCENAHTWTRGYEGWLKPAVVAPKINELVWTEEDNFLRAYCPKLRLGYEIQRRKDGSLWVRRPQRPTEWVKASTRDAIKQAARLQEEYEDNIRSVMVRSQTWDIEEYKIWKGIDLEKPCWASKGFACGSYEDANGLMEYMNGNNPLSIMRVVQK